MLTNVGKGSDLIKAAVWKSELWRHANDEPTREGAVKRLVKMLKGLITEAEAEGLKLARRVLQFHPSKTPAEYAREARLDDVGRQRMQAHVARNRGADRHREIDVAQRLYVDAGERLRQPRPLLVVDVHRRIDVG